MNLESEAGEILKNKFDVVDDKILRELEADHIVLRFSEIVADWAEACRIMRSTVRQLSHDWVVATCKIHIDFQERSKTVALF